MTNSYSEKSLKNSDALYFLSKLNYNQFMKVIHRFDRAHNKEISIDLWGYREQEEIDKIKLKNVEVDLKSYISKKNNVTTEYRDENGDLVFIIPTSSVNPFEDLESTYFLKENGKLGINYDIIDLEE